MRLESFGGADGRSCLALAFGARKINLQAVAGTADVVVVARASTPGSLDLCLFTAVPLDAVIAHLHEQGVVIEAGQVKRTGARFALRSAYIRDPDGKSRRDRRAVAGLTQSGDTVYF